MYYQALTNHPSCVFVFFSTAHLVIGAGGKELYEEDDTNRKESEAQGMKLKYYGEEFGFGYFSVSKSALTVQFIGENNNVLYEHTKYK